MNFIVRAVDDILKERFGIPDGLADKNRVTVLDFACGTGTFILEVFERIFENTGGADSAKAGLIVREHMLQKRLRVSHRALHHRAFEALAVPRGQGPRLTGRRAVASVSDQLAGANGDAEEFSFARAVGGDC